METAIWIIAIVEVIRVIEQSLQLRLLMKEAGARDNAYAEFVKSLKDSDREFVRNMLEEFEKMDEPDCPFKDAPCSCGETDCQWR